MGYQNAPATITVTRDGQPVDMRPDHERKVVAVFIGGEYVGTYRDRSSARQALGLIEVPAKRRK
jgi:hypothetical protein